MRLITQSQTAQKLTFLLVDSSDHISPKTGLSPTVTLSKAAGSFASPAGAVTEIGNGWYAVAGNTTDTNTLGSLILHATATGADPTDREYEIVSFDPQDAVRFGLTALPNAAAEASGGLYTRGTGAGQIKQTNNGEIDSNVTHVNNVATTSVTTINANLATTQPINFTGTGASALAKSDMVDVAGAAVSTSTAQLGVNAVNVGGTAQTGRDIGADTTTLRAALTPISSTVNDASASTTSFVTALSSSTTDFYAGDLIVFTSGTLTGVGRHISAYNGSTKAVTLLSALPSAPANSVAFTLVPLGKRLIDFLGTLGSDNKPILSTDAQTGVTIPTVTIVGALTTYTGNTPQTGDNFARIGAAGAGLTALGDTRIAHLNADIDSRMVSYTQPTGFLTATFPTTVASTTNITAGTIATVTNLTNAPTNGDLTATMKTSVTTAATAATPTIAGYTGNTAQTGDAFAIVNDSSFGNAKLVRSTTPGNTFDVSTTGEGGLDFNNIKDASAGHTLTNITVPTVTTAATATNVTTVNGLAAGVITAASIAADAITAAKIADGAIDAATFAAGAIDAAAIAADAIGSSELATSAVNEIRDAILSDSTAFAGASIAAIKAKTDTISTPPSAASIAAAVRDVNNTSPAASSLGAAVNSAGSAGDPWGTALPGSYGAGTAGKIIGDNINATVLSRLATSGYTAPPSAVTVATQVDTTLTASHGAGSWQTGSGSSGSGAFAVTVTVTDGSSALQNATVRLVEGANAFIALTNSSGVASFSLDAATYAITITKAGYSFTPATIIVSASGNFARAMTAIVIPAQGDPALTTAYAHTYSQQGVLLASQTVTFTLVYAPTGTGEVFNVTAVNATSDSNGLLTIGLLKSATYRLSFRTFTGTVFTGDADTKALDSLIG